MEKLPGQQGGGERAGGERGVELVRGPARAARGEDYLDEDLFAPFAHLCLDHRPGAGDSAVAVLPVADQVGDRAEVRVDGQLVAVQVVAGGLIFEVADRAGSVAGGDPRDVGRLTVGCGCRLSRGVLGRRGSRRPERLLTGGRARCIGGRPSACRHRGDGGRLGRLVAVVGRGLRGRLAGS